MQQLAATPYPAKLFTNIFSITNDDAKADSTKNDVDTGIPFLVRINRARGASMCHI